MYEKDIFIGRKKELELLRREIFVTEPGMGHCHSLIGPNDVGKTTLVRHLAEEFRRQNPQNVYYFSTYMENNRESFFWIFWSALIKKFSRVITEEKIRMAPNPDDYWIALILEAYEFFNDRQMLNQLATPAFDVDARGYLDDLFVAYTEIGIHIIVTIDEFDNARAAFPRETGDGSFFQRLFSLTPKGTSRLNLSILLLSRRRVGTIAHHMADGSDFEAGFPAITLRGFDDEELEEYFQTYDMEDCGIPDQQKREDILYFCGRHPGLLMKMRRAIVNSGEKTENIDIGTLYAQQGLEMTTVYERMCTLMRTEYVNQERTVNCIGTFVQTFIGPAYDPQLPDKVEQIYKYGFITKAYKDSKNLFVVPGASDGVSGDQTFVWEPLSPYFVEYIRNRVLPEELDGLGRLLFQTESRLRQVILTVLQKNFPENWERILDESTAGGKERYLQNLRRTAIANDADSRNITFTKLDVLAFYEYADIILHYREQMQPYIQSFRTEEELKEEFDFLTTARNCYAHNNSGILNERSCAHLRELCTRLLQDFEDGENGVVRPVETAGEEKTAAKTTKTTDGKADAQKQILAVDVMEMIGRKAVFCCKRKTARGSLGGIIKGTDYGASISPRKAAMLKETSPVGKEFDVVLEKWDENAQMFNLEI